MNQQQLIEQTLEFVQQTFAGAEGSHDLFHTLRVWKAARHIGAKEQVDMLVVELGALLHDIADSKFHGGDEEIGPRTAAAYLRSQGVEETIVNHVVHIVANISFRGGNHQQDFRSPELDVIQDADRLDALGAIGIARTFAYGGFKKRELYNPAIPPKPDMSKEEYKNSTAPSINHFYEKLLLLKDRMNTETGKQMAEDRHQFMVDYLARFYLEWNGEA